MLIFLAQLFRLDGLWPEDTENAIDNLKNFAAEITFIMH